MSAPVLTRRTRAAVLALRDEAAEEGRQDAARHALVRRTSFDRSHRTQVLAAWIEDHGIYGVGEQ